MTNDGEANPRRQLHLERAIIKNGVERSQIVMLLYLLRATLD